MSFELGGSIDMGAIAENNNAIASVKSRRRTRWRWLLAIAVVLGLAGVSSYLYRARIRANAEVRAVQTALVSRRFDEARRRINAWLARPHTGGAAEYYLAWLEVAQDHPVEAMSAIRRAFDSRYSRDAVMVLRAVLQARAGQFEEAEPELRRASAAGEEPRAEIAEALARIDMARFHFPEALAQLDRWAKAAPNDARPYLWKNKIEERNDVEAAVVINNHREALRRDPTLDSSRLGLAEMLLKAHKIDESESEFATYLARNPRSGPGHVGSAQIALLKGDLQGAETHLKDALESDPKDPIALRELGAIELRGGRFSEACTHLKGAVEATPFDVEVRYKYAQALKMSGEEQLAKAEIATTDRLRNDEKKVTDLRDALAHRPDDADLRSEVARFLIEHGHEKEGLEWTELILRQKPGHRATCLFLADFYAKKKNVGLANFYRLSAND